MLGGSFSSSDGGVVALVSGAVLAGAGLLVGPSVGHFYAGDMRRGFGWLGLRALLFGAGVGLSVGGMILAADGEGAGFALLATGISAGVVGLVLTVVDVIDAPAAARRARDRRRAPGASVQFAPLVALDGTTGALRCGALLVGRF